MVRWGGERWWRFTIRRRRGGWGFCCGGGLRWRRLWRRWGELVMSERSDVQGFLLGLVRPYWSRLLAGGLLLLVSAAAMVALPQLMRAMFDTALQSGDAAGLFWLALYMWLVVVLMAVGTMVRSQLIAVTGLKIVLELRQRLVAHLLTLEVGYFEGVGSGGVVSRVQSDTLLLLDLIRNHVPMLVRGVFLGIGVLVGLLYTSWYLTVVLVVAVLPLALLGWIVGRRLRDLSRTQQDNWYEFGRLVAELASQMQTITAFGLQRVVRGRLEENFAKAYGVAWWRIVLNSGTLSLNVLMGFTALIGVVWLGGLEVMRGEMTLGQMMAFLLYLAFAADAAGNVAAFWPAWQEVLGGSERVVALLKRKPLLVEAAQPVHLPVAKGGRRLELRGVDFGYAVRVGELALREVDMVVGAGQKVALVGPSGAGKSSVLRVLQRLEDVAVGEVLVDGIDVRQVGLAELRRQFALVAQDSPLFNATVAENLRMVRPEAEEAELWRVLRLARAEVFVRALPQGLATVVGERGVQLSGGQRQRLAIARALLADAPVLLLDEATSHLDSENEREIALALEEAGRGRTVVVIAHRISTILDADMIYVLEAGRVVGRGRHKALLRENEVYRGLAILQGVG
ncbi:MAG: ATP-binding cassette domain-containing protein [Proteobacteria bacterium]|nr:ATP-binding cassette domain-containing protein [Pseudomonadota bacterium]